ncbi:unannotated protein [freshwater metagenome]|uniref:Unannotated protein n=1 Tax=freshwater metagenome TaxID=449393 RepID=A0A6J7CNT6_9ZZZZ
MPVEGQRSEARCEDRPADPVDHDVDAASAGELAYLSCKRFGIGSYHVARAVSAGALTLVIGRRDADHLGAERRAELDAERAETARRSVDEDGHPGSDTPESMHGVPGRDPLREDGCCLRSSEPIEHREDMIEGRDDMIGVAAAVLHEDDHARAGRRPVGRPFENHAGDLGAGDEAQRLITPVFPAANHGVGEVHADRLNLHQHLPDPAFRAGLLPPGHDLRRSE